MTLRSIDYLEARNDVDTDRIGAMGISRRPCMYFATVDGIGQR